jgi:hypothetical protein
MMTYGSELVVHEVAQERRVFIQEAITAPWYESKRQSLVMRGVSECYERDTKTGRKIPKKMQGRVLSQTEAKELLEKVA